MHPIWGTAKNISTYVKSMNINKVKPGWNKRSYENLTKIKRFYKRKVPL